MARNSVTPILPVTPGWTERVSLAAEYQAHLAPTTERLTRRQARQAAMAAKHAATAMRIEHARAIGAKRQLTDACRVRFARVRFVHYGRPTLRMQALHQGSLPRRLAAAWLSEIQSRKRRAGIPLGD